tara:strand:- start:374 stop:1264 length:891 start_codon:yes stop_codon:yes gene_type:complete
MTTKRTSAVFGSNKLKKPWYKNPWFGLWGKDKRDWSKSLTDAEIREVERKMSLLNPAMSEDKNAGEIAPSMSIYESDWSPAKSEDSDMHSLDEIAAVPSKYETRMKELDDKMMGDQEARDLAKIYDAAGIDPMSDGSRRPYTSSLVYADDESESPLDLEGRRYMDERSASTGMLAALDEAALRKREEDRFLADDEAYIPEASTDYFDFADEATPGVKADGGFAESQKTPSEGLSPTEKFGAKLVMDMFKEKEDKPIQTVRGSNITPGRTFDLSSLLASTKRPKRERYRNKGLLARA